MQGTVSCLHSLVDDIVARSISTRKWLVISAIDCTTSCPDLVSVSFGGSCRAIGESCYRGLNP